MKSVKNLRKHLEPKYSVEEVMSEVYEDVDIKHFLEKHKTYLDEKTLELGKTKLLEFARFKNDPYYKIKIFLYDGQIAITYEPRDTPLHRKLLDKVPSKLIYDTSTLKYKGVRMLEYETDMHNIKAYGIVENFINNYKYGDKSRGIWLHGNFGVGKTYLMGAMATELNKRKVGVTFINAAQLVNDMYETIRRNSIDNSVQLQISYLQKAEVLIIDDIGTEKLTKNNVVDVIYTILKYRGEHNKPTFITSNFTKDQYYQMLNSAKIMDRIDIARLKEQIDVLTTEQQMIGSNRRVKASFVNDATN